MRLTREPPAVRFQARYSNDLWQFDLSPSDLKHVKAPRWVNDSKGEPTLMLYSVVDDQSGNFSITPGRELLRSGLLADDSG